MRKLILLGVLMAMAIGAVGASASNPPNPPNPPALPSDVSCHQQGDVMTCFYPAHAR